MNYIIAAFLIASFIDSVNFYYDKYKSRYSPHIKSSSQYKDSMIPVRYDDNANFRDDLFAGSSKQANLLVLCNIIKESDISHDSTIIVPFENRCREYIGLQWCHVNMLQYCAYPINIQLQEYEPIIDHHCDSSEHTDCLSYNMRKFPNTIIGNGADNNLFKLFFYGNSIVISSHGK